MKTAYACQDQRLVLQCPRDLVIKVRVKISTEALTSSIKPREPHLQNSPKAQQSQSKKAY
jgi:hypothetical protein